MYIDTIFAFDGYVDGTHDAASRRTASPTHYQRAVPAPTVFVLKYYFCLGDPSLNSASHPSRGREERGSLLLFSGRVVYLYMSQGDSW